MNKKAIGIIIGLMSAALLGVILLQMYWIRWSIELNEEQFNRNVFLAMNKVSERLQNAEDIKNDLEEYQYLNSPTPFLRTNAYKFWPNNSNKQSVTIDMTFSDNLLIDSLFKMSLLTTHFEEDNCNCALTSPGSINLFFSK